ncbi:hypothetical protein ABK040_007206 [Willaertia magna]
MSTSLLFDMEDDDGSSTPTSACSSTSNNNNVNKQLIFMDDEEDSIMTYSDKTVNLNKLTKSEHILIHVLKFLNFDELILMRFVSVRWSGIIIKVNKVWSEAFERILQQFLQLKREQLNLIWKENQVPSANQIITLQKLRSEIIETYQKREREPVSPTTRNVITSSIFDKTPPKKKDIKRFTNDTPRSRSNSSGGLSPRRNPHSRNLNNYLSGSQCEISDFYWNVGNYCFNEMKRFSQLVERERMERINPNLVSPSFGTIPFNFTLQH